MTILIISSVAFIASVLTLFSGFGLGTILMPVIAIFFPIEIAIGITAIVHLSNNLFKFVMFWKSANLEILMKFGIPAMIFSLIGAYLLNNLLDFQPVYKYELFGIIAKVTIIKIIIGLIIILFVILESLPKFSSMQINNKFLPLGGALSGFFGGLSGHQGALRSMFLIKSELNQISYIATGVILAVIVDLTRLPIYFNNYSNNLEVDYKLILTVTFISFVGSYFGAKFIKKVTYISIKYIVSSLLTLIALLMIIGLI